MKKQLYMCKQRYLHMCLWLRPPRFERWWQHAVPPCLNCCGDTLADTRRTQKRVRKNKDRHGKYSFSFFPVQLFCNPNGISPPWHLFQSSNFSRQMEKVAPRNSLAEPVRLHAQVLNPVPVKGRCQRELVTTHMQNSNIPVPQRWLRLVVTSKKDAFYSCTSCSL